jgi:hypothetical protein
MNMKTAVLWDFSATMFFSVVEFFGLAALATDCG